jgi:aminopeptidase N
VVLRKVLVVMVLGVLAAPGVAAAERFSPGAQGSDDPFFPLAGNGGYDVAHYSIDLRYTHTDNQLTGKVAVFARATQNLSRFDLDLRDFYDVSTVTVNLRRATFSHSGQELVITPPRGLRRGSRFVVGVEYAGRPEPVVDPDEAIEGWVPTDDGAFVVGEPQGTPGWIPVNDSLSDRASFDFAITVPKGKTAIANGTLLSRRDRGGMTTWRWFAPSPMVPYLATATNGVFQTRFERVSRGLWRFDAVDPQTRMNEEDPPNPALAFERLDPEPEIVDFFSKLYGPYPFESVGGIMDWAPDVGYALESQTRVNYDRIPDESTVVHEIAHQWFGDAVGLAVWPDMWLNEGFATFSEWIYDERHGGPTAQEHFEENYATPEDSEDGQDLWFPAPNALPDASVLFSTPVYTRGAMTLQALREKIGDRTFFALLRTWYRDNRNDNVRTADFIELAERMSGRDLDAFFDAWLFEEGRPTSW